MESFVIIVNGWKPLTIITKRPILDVAAALDPPLKIHNPVQKQYVKERTLQFEDYHLTN